MRRRISILTFCSAVSWTWLIFMRHHRDLATPADAALATVIAVLSTLALCTYTADAVFHRSHR